MFFFFKKKQFQHFQRFQYVQRWKALKRWNVEHGNLTKPITFSTFHNIPLRFDFFFCDVFIVWVVCFVCVNWNKKSVGFIENVNVCEKHSEKPHLLNRKLKTIFTQSTDFNLSEGCFPILLRIFYKFIQHLYDFL